jgi:hypothetical protein
MVRDNLKIKDLEGRICSRGVIHKIERGFFEVKVSGGDYVKFYFKDSYPCSPPREGANVRVFWKGNSEGGRDYLIVRGLSASVNKSKREFLKKEGGKSALKKYISESITYYNKKKD